MTEIPLKRKKLNLRDILVFSQWLFGYYNLSWETIWYLKKYKNNKNLKCIVKCKNTHKIKKN
jgi:hypothetical protein